MEKIQRSPTKSREVLAEIMGQVHKDHNGPGRIGTGPENGFQQLPVPKMLGVDAPWRKTAGKAMERPPRSSARAYGNGCSR